MVILKNVDQIKEAVNKLFVDGVMLNDVSDFIERKMTINELLEFSCKIKSGSLSAQVEEISTLIFQLRDYMFALSNFANLLLLNKNFDGIYFFISKFFVGQIGRIKYASINGCYTFVERYFDRFVEIVKNCEISPKLYLPLVTECLNDNTTSKVKAWKMPASEFMQSFFNENEKWMFDYINSKCEIKYEILEAICNFNTQRGIGLLIHDFNSKEHFDYEKSVHILKNYKRETVSIMDKMYNLSCDEEKKNIVEIFVSFLPDIEVSARLEDVFNKENNEEIKNIIASKLGITATLAIKTEKQFLYAVKRKIKEPQERALGVPFDRIDLKLKSGFVCDNEIFSFLIYLLKEEKNLCNIKKLLVLENIFEENGLQEFAGKMFDVLSQKDDILQAKWAVRFFALFSSGEFEKKIYDFLLSLYFANRNKEAKYLTECLINAGKIEVFDVLKILLEKNNLFVKENIEAFKEEFAARNEVSIDEIDDMLVEIEMTKENIELQTERLFLSFLNNRQITNEKFEKLYLKNPLMLSLASRIVWGEYSFERLHNVFKIIDGKKTYIVKNSDLVQYQIGIVHSLDLDDRFDAVLDSISEPLFTQFKMFSFDKKSFLRTAVSVNRFTGMFVSTKCFVEALEQKGFVVNKYENEVQFSSIVFVNADANLIAEIEFEHQTVLENAFSTIDQIYFYKLNDVTRDKGKYLTKKSNVISLFGVPYRFFDFVLSSVSESAKRK